MIGESDEGEWMHQLKMCSKCGHTFGHFSDKADCGRPECEGNVRPIARYCDMDSPDRMDVMDVAAELERAAEKAQNDGRRREKRIMTECAEQLRDTL
jgi:predicted  nucleic acid-binding Zn-ribbon protein